MNIKLVLPFVFGLLLIAVSYYFFSPLHGAMFAGVFILIAIIYWKKSKEPAPIEEEFEEEEIKT